MKKILYPIALIGTLVLGGVLAMAIWSATGKSTEDYIKDGKKFYEQKEYSKASILFLNAVKKGGNDRDARYYLALTYIAQGDLSSAVKQLVTLLEIHPTDTEASLKLGNIYLGAGSTDSGLFKQSLEIANKILAREPNNVDALILSGNALAGSKEYVDSVKSFEKAISVDPQNASAFVSLGTTQALQKHYPEAEQAFLKAQQADPKNESALISLATYYRVTGEAAKAEAIFKEAISYYPSDTAIYTQLVQLYYQNGRFDDGVKLLQDLQAKTPKDSRPSLLLADLYTAKNMAPETRKVLQDLKKTFPKDVGVAIRRAVDFLRDQPEQAKAEIDLVTTNDPTNPVGWILQGQLQYQTENYDAAQKALERPEVTASRYPEAQFFLGNIAAKKGDAAKAQEYFRKAVRLNPQYLAARVALAESLLNQGKNVEARAEINSTLAFNKDYPMARLMKGVADRSEKRYAEAESGLAALAKEQPNNPTVLLQLAYSYDAAGKSAEAEKTLLRAFELQPESKETLQALVLLYVKAKQPDKAIQRINAIPDAKKEPFHYELLAAVYSQAGKDQESEAVLKKALEKDPKDAGADALLISQYVKTGRMDDALKQLDKLITKAPTNATAYTTKGMIFENQGKTKEAKEVYAQALRLNPKDAASANNLAYIYAEEGTDLQAGLGYAQMARKVQPDSPNVADTLGWIYYKLGNHSLARDQFLFAVSKDATEPVFQFHLGLAYKATGKTLEAQNALKRALDSPKDFKEKPLAQAALKELQGQK